MLQRAAFEQPPPGRVDIELARRAGRRRLRWRRAGLAGTPATAAIAVVALVTSGALSPSLHPGYSHPAGHHSPRAEPGKGLGQVRPPRRFNPLIPYAAFGWLPKGETLDGGQIASTYTYLTAGHARWALTVFVAGRCDRTQAELLAGLRHGEHPVMRCTTSASSGYEEAVNGAFTISRTRLGFLTTSGDTWLWQYAKGSWAILSGPPERVAGGQALKIAERVRYAVASKPSIKFPAQLTRLPSSWTVSFTYFRAQAGVLRASQYSLATPGQDSPNLTTNLATPHSRCYFYPKGQSVHRTINGYRVTVNHLKGASGRPPTEQVCAAHADGLFVFVSTYGPHQQPNAVAIFAHHLRLLGTNPADWTVRPIR